jgi:hypothetical protein
MVVVGPAKSEPETEHGGNGPNIDRRGINHRSWCVNHGRLLINDRGLLDNHRLRLNNGWGRLSGLLHHDLLGRLLNDDRCGLLHDDGRRIDVNGRRRINGLGDKQARPHACQNCSRGMPASIMRLNSGRRGAEYCQG